MKVSWIIGWSALAFPVGLSAVTPEQTEFFESRIRPILAQECYECHSEQGKRKGGLLLDSRPGWQEGGDSGEALVLGDAAASLLIQTIRHEHEDLKMPKSGAKLDDSVIGDFVKWVNSGAPDPRDTPPTSEELAEQTDWSAVLERRKQWWAFQPVPQKASGSEIDDFIDAKLSEEGVPAARKAEAEILQRRTSFVLTGLPPTEPSNDSISHEAYVDELLASSAFGEKWARHFMDWVRYAESYGSEGDPPIPYAYRYRDYLIRAFNDDVPYPQLVREAIAGDLMAVPRTENGLNESAIGVGQLRMVQHGFSPVDSLDEMVAFTDNQIDTVTKAFLGLTVSCARCHNHKFDAISQADFYALYGIFTSTHPAVIDANEPGAGDAIRNEMKGVKTQIREAMAAEWLEMVDAKRESDPTDTSDPCHMNWKGLERSAPGDFSVALKGDRVIERIYPAAYVSDLLSPKDRAVIVTSEFENPGGKLWMRLAGNGGVKAKYVVHNYPRTGTIHKAIELKEAKDETLEWRSLDLDFWKGDEIFLQVTTAADMPAEFKDNASWFALDDALITKSDEAPPPVKVSTASPRFLVEAWKRGTITSAGAEALNGLLRSGKLVNKGGPEVARLLKHYRDLEAKLPEPTRVPGVIEGDPADAALFVQGDHKQPAETVPRRFLDALNPMPFETRGSGRLELAERMADMESNPLTARVIVNRLWHHVFGRGIVASVDNFGKLGELPTHPELLDELARRFIVSGGSIKGMLKTMLMSEAFQRSGEPSPLCLERDPENKWLSHWSMRRMEAEAVRDSILVLSGNLDDQPYGPSVGGTIPRRSVYVKVIRNALDPLLTTFDAPVPFMTRGRRDSTNVPAQSLTLLNDESVIKWTGEWAERSSANPDMENRVRQMFREALGRDAKDDEVAQSVAYIEEVKADGVAVAGEIERRRQRLVELTARLANILDPARAALHLKRELPQPPKGLPQPLAEWTFDKDLSDTFGRLPLELEGKARIANGALILDGESMAASGSLPKRLKAKTLEAWVQLDDLKQRGGGVVTVQENNGGVFDSIVFGERKAGHWVAGSDRGNRSEDFDGNEEADAANRVVHVAIVYQGDGTISGYRDGKPYGRTFRKASGVIFEAEKGQVLLGCRHGAPRGNHGLRGKIFRARVYDRALSAEEILKTARVEGSTLTEDEVVASLSVAQQEEVARLMRHREEEREFLSGLQSEGRNADPEQSAWASFAQSLINLKEFIYLR